MNLHGVSIASNKDTDMTNNVRRFDKILVSSLMNVYITFRLLRVCMDVCVTMHTYALTKACRTKNVHLSECKKRWDVLTLCMPKCYDAIGRKRPS